jgi:hypothetical protein
VLLNGVLILRGEKKENLGLEILLRRSRHSRSVRLRGRSRGCCWGVWFAGGSGTMGGEPLSETAALTSRGR